MWRLVYYLKTKSGEIARKQCLAKTYDSMRKKKQIIMQIGILAICIKE